MKPETWASRIPLQKSGVWKGIPAKTKGVYILYIGKKVIYVGYSNSLWNRLTSHEIRDFDGFKITPPCCNHREAEFIGALRPPRNIIFNAIPKRSRSVHWNRKFFPATRRLIRILERLNSNPKHSLMRLNQHIARYTKAVTKLSK